MNIQISNPILVALYNYFTDMNELYTRKKFNFVMLILSVFIVIVYSVGTDFNTLESIQVDLNKEISNISDVQELNPEKALAHLMTDEEFVNDFSKKTSDAIPSMFWICLMMLVSIPAIIKRTNDTFLSQSHSYPVGIYYVLYFLQSLTGLYINFFQIYNALAIYSTIFILLIAIIPSKENDTDEEF